jgi:hypothetical protein
MLPYRERLISGECPQNEVHVPQVRVRLLDANAG